MSCSAPWPRLQPLPSISSLRWPLCLLRHHRPSEEAQDVSACETVVASHELGPLQLTAGRALAFSHGTHEASSRDVPDRKKRSGCTPGYGRSRCWPQPLPVPNQCPKASVMAMECYSGARAASIVVQDWASSAAVPLMGGPRVGATSNPYSQGCSQGFERRVPRIHLSVGPRYIH